MLLFSFFNAQGKENRSECVVPEPSRDKQEEEKKQMSVRQVFFFRRTSQISMIDSSMKEC